jgi:16S rRNA (guanine527-N7)-methyltransferase
VARLRSAETIADLGAGAGFPGLALAVALPQAEVHLLESAGRKCEVITRLARNAGLRNARAIHVRAEDHGGGAGSGYYDAVTARALAPLPVLAEYAAPLLRLGGVLVAWKGARSRDEEERGDAAAAELGLAPAGVLPVRPFAGARDRHLHVFEKVAPTPERFPRRAGIALKRPLGA